MSVKNTMLLTGYRLLAILESLYKKDMPKHMLKEELCNKYGIKKLSDETLKLDLNTLIEAGFNIKRGNMHTFFNIRLDKNFNLMQLSKNDILLLTAIKKYTLGCMTGEEIFDLKNFYTSLLPYTKEQYHKILTDFEMFDKTDKEIFNMLNKSVKTGKWCSIIYKTAENRKKIIEIFPLQIVTRNRNLYLNCFFEKQNKNISIKLSNILNVNNIKKENHIDYQKEKSTQFIFQKKYPYRAFLDADDKILYENQKEITVETNEKCSFFLMQKLLSCGLNCKSLNNEKLKNEIINHITGVLELYK